MEPIRLSGNNDRQQSYPTAPYLQVVGSPIGKFNSETLSLRLDCHLALKQKADFIAELSLLCQLVRINVFYYLDKDFATETNLMLLFTNGRQGVDLQAIEYIDTKIFENKISELLSKYGVQLGHLGGYELYPQHGPNIELIVDQEFVIRKRSA